MTQLRGAALQAVQAKRAREARVEGAAAAPSPKPWPVTAIEQEAARHPAPEPLPKACDEGAADLEAIVAAFRREFPDVWAGIALSPLQYGLDQMLTTLKARASS